MNHLNRLEKILGVTSIVSLILYFILKEFFKEELDFSVWLLILSPVAGFTLNLYLLRNTQLSFLWFMMLFFSFTWVTILFKIFHLPAADILGIFSYLLYFPLLGVTFLVLGSKSLKSTKKYLIIVGLLLIFQFSIPIVLESWNQGIPRVIVSYLLTAATFTAAIKYPSGKQYEKRLMILLFIDSSLNIVHHIFA